MHECNSGAPAAWAWRFVDCGCASGNHGCKCFGAIVYAVPNVVQAFATLFNCLGNW
jgi:hypothetical protein